MSEKPPNHLPLFATLAAQAKGEPQRTRLAPRLKSRFELEEPADTVDGYAMLEEVEDEVLSSPANPPGGRLPTDESDFSKQQPGPTPHSQSNETGQGRLDAYEPRPPGKPNVMAAAEQQSFLDRQPSKQQSALSPPSREQEVATHGDTPSSSFKEPQGNDPSAQETRSAASLQESKNPVESLIKAGVPPVSPKPALLRETTRGTAEQRPERHQAAPNMPVQPAAVQSGPRLNARRQTAKTVKVTLGTITIASSQPSRSEMPQAAGRDTDMIAAASSRSALLDYLDWGD